MRTFVHNTVKLLLPFRSLFHRSRLVDTRRASSAYALWSGENSTSQSRNQTK